MTLGRALIVGAGGQVGGALARALGSRALCAGRAETPQTPVVLDLANLAAQPKIAETQMAVLQPDAVFCVGGATDVERCESDVAWAMNVNCYGPAALAAACTSLPFVYFSTEYVFDGDDGPYRENSKPRPLSTYGRSKWEGEQAILRVHPNPLLLRTTVVYGPDRQAKNFLYTLRRVLGSGQAMRVPADQISTPTYNVDLAAAAIELVQAGQTGTVHVCGPELLSRFAFAVLAAECLGLDTRLLAPVSTAELGQRARRPLRAGLLTDKLRELLRSTCMRSNAEAIRDWQRQEETAAA